MGSIIELNDENFNREVIETKGVVVVDFWAAWCGPCRMLAPVLQQVADEMGDKAKVCKYNVDDGIMSQQFSIMSIPTIVVFKDGKQVDKNVGMINKTKIIEFINKYV